MANNKVENVTIPLQANLNMNSNQSFISDSFDMFNENNAPIFGGALSPLYVQTRDGNSNAAIYDKHGNGWYINKENNVMSVRKIDESSSSSTGTDVLTGGRYSFEEIDLSDFPYPVDQAVIDGTPTDVQGYYRFYVVFGYYNSSGSLMLGRVYVDYNKITKKASYSVTHAPKGRGVPLQFRLVDNWLQTTPQTIALVTIGQAYDEGYFPVSLAFLNLSNTTQAYFDTIKSKDVYLEKPLEEHSVRRVPGDQSTYYGEDVQVKPSAGSSMQIIISAPFTLYDWYGITSGTPVDRTVRGISILNKRQTGNNAHKHLAWGNCIFECDSNMASRKTDRFNIGDVDNIHINPGPRCARHGDDKYSNGQTTFPDSWPTRTNINQWTGMFVDDSTVVIMATSWLDSRMAKGSSGDHWWNTGYDFSEGGACFSDYYKNNEYTLYANAPYYKAASIIYQTDDNDSDNRAGVLTYNILPTLVTNQRHYRFTLAGPCRFKEALQGYWTGWLTDNMSGVTPRVYPGLTSSMTLPDSDTKSWSSTDSDDSSIWYRREEIDDGIYNSQGSMAQLNNGYYGGQPNNPTNWRLLFNYKEGYVSGISYAKGDYVASLGGTTDRNAKDYVGTMVTQWDAVDDAFFVQARPDFVLYKNTKTQGMKMVVRVDPFDWYSATSQTSYRIRLYDNNILRIVAERYIVWNTDAYYNCYDIETGKKGHWASDWNNRILHGMLPQCQMQGDSSDEYNFRRRTNYGNSALDYDTVAFIFLGNTYKRDGIFTGLYKTGTTASAADVGYQSEKTFAPSRLLPYNSYRKIYTGQEQVFGAKIPAEETGYNYTDRSKVDYFFSSGSTAPLYRSSIVGQSGDFSYGYSNNNSYVINSGNYTFDGELEGTTYPVASSGTALYNFPIVGLDFIQSYAGKFGVKIGKTGYSIQYDGIRPVGLYNSTSMVDDIDTFFIIQSQYYGIVNDYICAISYSSSNVLNGIEQIVNVNGMQFIGSLPSCAYFYSPTSKAIFAFTGDADLKLFVQTDRISEVKWHLYAPNNEWIYIGTDDGLYVITQNNIFRWKTMYTGSQSIGLDQSIDNGYMWKAFETDQEYNILEDWNGNIYKVKLYPADQAETNQRVKIETAFFGPGDMKQDVIDCWYIKFYKPKSANWLQDSDPKVYIRQNTITDQFYKGKAEVFEISGDMWDDNNNYMLRYQPDNQMAQGAQLTIDSPYPISYIGFSKHMDNTTVTPAGNSKVVATSFDI